MADATSLDALRVTFFQECEDLLERLGEGLRDLSGGGDHDRIETVHAVFRAVHSIKGGAGAFGLDDLVGFAHLFETVLDHLRAARMTATPGLLETLLRAGDILADLVAAARDGTPAAPGRMARVAAELDALADGLGGEPDDDFVFEPLMLSLDPAPPEPEPARGDDPAPGPNTPDPGPPDPGEAATPRFEITLHPRGEFYHTGNEPAGLLRALAGLGRIEVRADDSAVQPLATFDPEAPALAWSITLAGDTTADAIARIFEFVEDLAEITITPAPATPDPEGGEPAPGHDSRNGAPAPPGDSLPGPASGRDSGCDSAPDSECVAALPAESGATGRHGDTGTTAAAPAAAPDAATGAPPGPAPAPRDHGAAGRSGTVVPLAAPATIRVNLDRVDRLINLVGELVITEATLSQAIADAGFDSSSEAAGSLDRIRQLAGEVQESVMAIRAQPLRPVFQRMERILRETCDATGKRARLVTLGDATEVDKTVIERLVDPLTHMIRNSVDHGLEDGARRAAAGKPAEGTITLSAAHRSGRVVIEVADDGGGIDRARVREIAEQRGLIAGDAALAPAEIDGLLFLPGFSSKAEVSAVSGRGVGLDVVRRDIHALGGRVSIGSAAGAGTTFTIALPLTLAVLEGMLLEFGGQVMVLPLTAIVETIAAASATVHTLGQGGRVVANRGALVPIVELGAVFGLPATGAGRQAVLVVIESGEGRRAALAVDRILDQRQVVIKSLEDNYGSIAGIAAATILGDGRIALIIDPEEVVRHARPDAAPLAERQG